MTNQFKKALIGSVLALGATVKSHANDNQITNDTKEVVSTTKVKVDDVRNIKNGLQEKGYGVTGNQETGYVLEQNHNGFSFSDVLAQNINFAKNPSTSITIGKVSELSADDISAFKKVPGVRVQKGELIFTPSKVLAFLSTEKTLDSSKLNRVFAGNKFMIQNFQLYLNSKLGIVSNTFSGVIDQETITKTSSVLKNESIFNVFSQVLPTYGPTGLGVLNIEGRAVLVNTKLEGEAYKDAVAVLDLPFFDEKGQVQFLNGYNNYLLELPTEGSSKVASLNNNTVRFIIKNWLQSIEDNSENIQQPDFDVAGAQVDKQAQDEKIKAEAEKAKAGKMTPSIISSKGQMLSGSIAKNSGMDLMLKTSGMGFNYEDDITLDKVNIKATLELIAEATNMGDNSRVAAKLIMLYSMARVGTVIYAEKGNSTAAFGIGASYMRDNGDIIKLDYGFFRKFLEYTFPEVNKKMNLAPDQHGVSVSYTKKEIEQFEILKEMTFSLRAFKVDSINVGEIGKLTTDVGNIFEQYQVLGALQGGKKVEAEVNFAFDLGKALSEEMGLMDLRLDIAPRVGYTKYDDVLDKKGQGEVGAGLKAKITTLLTDSEGNKTWKVSLGVDGYTGGLYSYGFEVSKKLQTGEVTFYAKQQEFGTDVKGVTSVGIKGSFENPFGLQENDEQEVPTYASLFAMSQKNIHSLTYNDADIDKSLVSGYAITPQVQIQKIRELKIDKDALPDGSTLDKNDDGTLKQINLNTGVNNLDGTIQVNPASFNSHFSVTGNSFVTVKNLEKMNVPGVYNIVAGQTGGTSVIMVLALTKGSVMITQGVQSLSNVPNDLAQEFLNGTKTFEQIKAIMAVNTPPVPTFSNFTMNEDTVYNGTLTATDDKNATLSFSKVSNPSHGTVVVNTNGAFTYTPNANYFGADSFTYSVSDGVNIVSQIVNVTINDVPEEVAPIMGDVPNQTYTSGSAITNLNVGSYVTQTNGDAITSYTLTGALPAGLVFDSTTGVLSGTPTVTGTFNLSVTATDNDGVSNSDSFTITVNAPVPAEVPPVMGDVPNQTYTSGSAITNLNVGSYVTQTNGDAITSYTLTGALPAGLVFDSTTGVLSGTPTVTGTFNLSVTATDNDGVSNSDSFTITVNAPAPAEVPPVMGDVPNQTYTSGIAITNLNVGSYVTQTNGDAITSYTLTGTLPTGLSFNPTTGVLSGTPTQTGTFNMSVTATDNDGVSNSDAFSITVNEAIPSSSPSLTPSGLYSNAGNSYLNNANLSTATFNVGTVAGATGYKIQVNNGALLDILSGNHGFSDHVSVDGTYTFKVYACNASGCSTTPTEITVIKNTEVPTSLNLQIPATTSSTTITINGAATGTGITWFLANNSNVPTSGTGVTLPTSYVLPSSVLGSYQICGKAVNIAGNVSATTFCGTTELLTADNIGPSLTLESIGSLDTSGGSFSGTLTFDEAVAVVDSISFTSGGGTISVNPASLGTTTLSISGTAPNVGQTAITLTVKDAAGNSKTVTTQSYDLF